MSAKNSNLAAEIKNCSATMEDRKRGRETQEDKAGFLKKVKVEDKEEPKPPTEEEYTAHLVAERRRWRKVHSL